ncbi:MAG: glutamate 5-kinase, partial [Rikenellaceae bacterium]
MDKEVKRVVVKIGSNVLTRPDGTLDTERMASLTAQVAGLHKRGIEVIVVSSGAVASGREVIKPKSKRLSSVAARQLFSAVGQAKLINIYYNLFAEYGIVCGQVLTTKESLSTRGHYLNQRNCMRV